MKLALVAVLLFLYSKTVGYAVVTERKERPNENKVFVITLDGFRWQEFFKGADEVLLKEASVSSKMDLKKTFWDDDVAIRRRKLMPFTWDVIAQQGLLLGNRAYGSKVNVSNLYALSYAGYNEMFTGGTDFTIFSNRKIRNQNVSFLEHINKLPQFKGKVAAITSWDVFPYIFNKTRSRLYIDCNSKPDVSHIPVSMRQLMDDHSVRDGAVRNDLFTFAAAKEYITKNLPRLLHIGLSGTDEAAHQHKYGDYLQQAHLADKIIGWLWQLTQKLPYYRDHITFIITTDHGRGSKRSNWNKHNFWIKGSSETWMALIGNGVKQMGEYKGRIQLYQKQVAGTIGYFLNVRSFNNYTMPLTCLGVIDDR
ncbi:alkaline phosphatase family protein [Chitinophagaceae bacterium LB-8]|uniref:Alkaline phosphatase family protein n=1 Tax=Paraflavisolibacter caeni TaxID=2982496 RepID=A0A9X2Y144_9BACT|nr:alkaline phosphatase family protein [Paraflavisolibacter caeni]MCU7551253.1 alkaline phosphatase family protein [Paraflavisolibacter caeni]